MIETHGLTHISLAVEDPERALRFYADAFGFREYFRDATSIQARRDGGWEVIAFERDAARAGQGGGVSHFGFRLVRASDIDVAVEIAIEAGGTLLRRGEFALGFPFAYVSDPDGYEIEIWFE
jgi:catechol 2,3-dioxygenase-like lactoylglutathione lyase family enzyme